MPTEDEIRAARLSIEKANRELHAKIQDARKLLASCPHWVEKTPYSVKGFVFPNGRVVNEDSDSPSAWCGACGLQMGWWCDKSPDHLCDYVHDGMIDNDDCVHCHQPDERK